MFMTDLTGTIKNLFNRQWAESGRGGLGLLFEHSKYTPIILFYKYAFKISKFYPKECSLLFIK